MKKFLILSVGFFLAFANANAKEQKIVAVGGALTEIIYELGAANQLVGVDSTSYYPESVKKLPQVGYQRALSAEGILSLKPDLIILTNEAGPDSVIAQIKSSKQVEILQLKAGRSFADVAQNINLIGKKIGKEKEAKTLIARLENDKKQLDEIIKNQKNQKKVMFILNHGGSSPMVAGLDTAANSIIEISGAKNVVTDYKSYKPLTPEAALILAPDIILISDEGLKQFGGKEKLLNNAALKLTPAAKNQRVIVMDSMLMLGFGPRIIEAAKLLNSQY